MTPSPDERRFRPAAHFATASVAFFIVATLVSQSWRLRFAEQDELHRVVGGVEEIQLTGSKQRGPELTLLVKVGSEVRRYSQLDLRQRSPALATLKPGETIELDVDHFALTDRRGAYWAIRRGSDVLLAYSTTRRVAVRWRDDAYYLAAWCALLASTLGVIGVVLRVRRGTWR